MKEPKMITLIDLSKEKRTKGRKVAKVLAKDRKRWIDQFTDSYSMMWRGANGGLWRSNDTK